MLYPTGAASLIALLLTLLPAVDALAQGEVLNRVQIVGRVIDEQTGQPLRGVNVFARNHADQRLQRVTTDEMGRFTLNVYRVSAIRISASRSGYRQAITPLLHFDGKDYYEIEIRLHPDVVLLAPLEVIARAETSGSPILTSFRHRLTRGLGYYITRAEIERRKPMYVTDLLADVPGVHLTSSGRGTSREVHIGRSAASGCPVQFWVDGRLMNRRFVGGGPAPPSEFSIDDVVSPESVEGIEVYRGASTIPPEFYGPDASCGVIAVWTRRNG